jgi:hypothetical protein
MRMLILRHLGAESALAQNREWKERRSAHPPFSDIDHSLSFAVALKMRMPILRHLSAESPPAPNREWKERPSAHPPSSGIDRSLVRGCSENTRKRSRDREGAVISRALTALFRSRFGAGGRVVDFHRWGCPGLPVMESSEPCSRPRRSARRTARRTAPCNAIENRGVGVKQRPSIARCCSQVRANAVLAMKGGTNRRGTSWGSNRTPQTRRGNCFFSNKRLTGP